MTSRPPRILMIVPELDRIGGYELQALALGGALTARGISVWILTDGRPGSPARERWHGLWIYRIGEQRYPRVLLPPWRWRRRGLEDSVATFMRNHAHRFDAVHGAAFASPCDVAMRVARQLGKPALLKVATLGDPTQIAVLARSSSPYRRNWQGLLRANHLLCISQAIAEEFRSLEVPERKLCSIPNGVDAESYHPPSPIERQTVRQQLQLEPDTLVYAFVGRLAQRKGVDVLLRAWSIFTQQRSRGVALLIIGDGEEGPRLRQMARAGDLEQTVHFQGMRHDVARLLHAADVFVFPSRREGLSNALLQAMSTGLPAIATRIGGNVDLIDDETHGLLCEPDDTFALAAALERMAADAEFRRHAGAAGRQRILKRYAFPRILDLLLPLYEINAPIPANPSAARLVQYADHLVDVHLVQ